MSILVDVDGIGIILADRFLGGTTFEGIHDDEPTSFDLDAVTATADRRGLWDSRFAL